MLDPYDAYYAAMTRAGITPLSREWYYRAITQPQPPRFPLSDAQFDHDREREGDAQ